jgi:polyisoprenyl-teichoic acid--peptidoglycan teichoic acid transferase
MVKKNEEQLNDPTRKKAAPGSGDRKKISRGSKVAIFVALFIIVLVVLTAVVAFAYFNQVKETQRILLEDVSFEEEYDLDLLFPEHIVNIGLLGFDRGWNREELGEDIFRPDMLAVLSIDFETNQISVVRVPRDSYVPIHGQGGFHDKINHSYYYGYIRGGDDPEADGIRNTLQTVSNVLGGIPIHYYISVDMYSIIELVDAFGGIYYEVEETIYDKYWNVGEVLVPEGPQLMDGKTYLRYLQYRDDKTNQDYGRIDRQMNLLKHTFLYLKEKGRITDIPAIYRIYRDYVDTDLSSTKIAALAYYARDFQADDENLHFYTILGDGRMKDGIWYQVIFQSDRLRIIKEVFGIDAEPWPALVLEDSPEYLAEQERKRLEEAGLTDDWSGLPNGDEENILIEQNTSDESGNLVLVPDLTGMMLEEARSRLAALGLESGNIDERYYHYMEAGLVVFSDPQPGKSVYPGVRIDLVVSLGPEPPAE